MKMQVTNNVQLALRLRPLTAPHWAKRLVLLGLLIAAGIHSAAAQTCSLQGTVSVSSTNGSNDRLPGASLELMPAAQGKTPLSTVTNDQGDYKFTNLAAGIYTLQVTLSGFKQHSVNVTVRAGGPTVQNIELELAGISDSVTVVADGDELNLTATGQSVSFKQEKLQTLPLVNERFQDTIPLVPGVVRGPDGLLNLKGARSSQSGMTV